MSKFIGTLIVAALLVPAALSAQPATPFEYEKFSMSRAETRQAESARYRNCMEKSGGVTAAMRSCNGDEFTRVDALLNRQYKRTMARLNAPAKTKLRATQRSWIKTRYDECEREFEGEKGGSLWFIEMDGCSITEVSRRTLWLQRYSG
jgi:uncharacterized protein YecT (DUF1311 family)